MHLFLQIHIIRNIKHLIINNLIIQKLLINILRLNIILDYLTFRQNKHYCIRNINIAIFQLRSFIFFVFVIKNLRLYHISLLTYILNCPLNDIPSLILNYRFGLFVGNFSVNLHRIYCFFLFVVCFVR